MTFYRILCCTPPGMEPERLRFEACNAEFGEKLNPLGILFAAASLLPPFVPERRAPAVESNIRTCDFLLAVFGEQRPHPAYERFVDLALECLNDAAMPMRQVSVLFRKPTEADEPIRDLREKLSTGGGCHVAEFRDEHEFELQVREILAHWYAAIGTAKPPFRAAPQF